MSPILAPHLSGVYSGRCLRPALQSSWPVFSRSAPCLPRSIVRAPLAWLHARSAARAARAGWPRYGSDCCHLSAFGADIAGHQAPRLRTARPAWPVVTVIGMGRALMKLRITLSLWRKSPGPRWHFRGCGRCWGTRRTPKSPAGYHPGGLSMS